MQNRHLLKFNTNLLYNSYDSRNRRELTAFDKDHLQKSLVNII